MSKLSTPYPLPDPVLPAIKPELLAVAAANSLRQVYGIELDYTPESLRRLQAVMRERFRMGAYKQDSFPSSLALVIGVYIAEILRRQVAGGRWGEPDEDLYGTPLPFLLFTQGEYERQLNIVEDFMTYLWSGQGLSLPDYYLLHLQDLQRLGFKRN